MLSAIHQFDGRAVEEGYVSVTPMGLNLHTDSFAEICRHFHTWQIFHEVEAH
jgi:hypothetical protein